MGRIKTKNNVGSRAHSWINSCLDLSIVVLLLAPAGGKEAPLSCLYVTRKIHKHPKGE